MNHKHRLYLLWKKISSVHTLQCLTIFLLYCTAISFFLMGANLCLGNEIVQNKLQKGIAKQVIRLHVVANSDSEYDQKLKLRVRDQIITGLQKDLQSAGSVKEAKKILSQKLSQIEKTAGHTLQSAGSHQKVQVSLKNRAFPVKRYGDLTFPKGTYQALCVEIGQAQGHNWWCVLFPSLCFVDETTAIVPEESKEKLKHSLTREEYDELTKEIEPHSLLFDKLFTGSQN